MSSLKSKSDTSGERQIGPVTSSSLFPESLLSLQLNSSDPLLPLSSVSVSTSRSGMLDCFFKPARAFLAFSTKRLSTELLPFISPCLLTCDIMLVYPGLTLPQTSLESLCWMRDQCQSKSVTCMCSMTNNFCHSFMYNLIQLHKVLMCSFYILLYPFVHRADRRDYAFLVLQ